MCINTDGIFFVSEECYRNKKVFCFQLTQSTLVLKWWFDVTAIMFFMSELKIFSYGACLFLLFSKMPLGEEHCVDLQRVSSH